MHPIRSLSVGSSFRTFSRTGTPGDDLRSPSRGRLTQRSTHRPTESSPGAVTTTTSAVFAFASAAAPSGSLLSSIVRSGSDGMLKKPLQTLAAVQSPRSRGVPPFDVSSLPDLSSPTARPHLVSLVSKILTLTATESGGEAALFSAHEPASAPAPAPAPTHELTHIDLSLAFPVLVATSSSGMATNSARSTADSLDGFGAWLQYATPRVQYANATPRVQYATPRGTTNATPRGTADSSSARSGFSIESTDNASAAAASSFAICVSSRVEMAGGMTPLMPLDEDNELSGGGGEGGSGGAGKILWMPIPQLSFGNEDSMTSRSEMMSPTSGTTPSGHYGGAFTARSALAQQHCSSSPTASAEIELDAFLVGELGSGGGIAIGGGNGGGEGSESGAMATTVRPPRRSSLPHIAPTPNPTQPHRRRRSTRNVISFQDEFLAALAGAGGSETWRAEAAKMPTGDK